MSINNIYDYAEAGFRVFALHGIDPVTKQCECDNPECPPNLWGKHPRVSAWQQTPYWDDDQLEAMTEYTITTGYGVCLDSHLILDIDARHGGFEAYNKLCDDLGLDLEALSGFVVETGGGGKHIYFSVPKDARLMAHHRDYPGIDMKNGTGGGSYVVGAGSMHVSGQHYEISKGNPCDLTEAPAELLYLLHKEERKNAVYEGIEVEDKELLELLSHLSPDVTYEDWIKVGMAIHDATRGEGLSIWDEWSSRGEKYPGYDQLSFHWHSFGKSQNPVRVGTLFRMAQENGYVRPVTFESAHTVSSATDVEYAGEEKKDDPPPEKPKHVRMLDALLANDDSEMARVSQLTWLIDGLIPSDSFGVVFGAPGDGKSFVAVDMACSVAAGHPWQGMETGDEGVVVYISAEGGNGMRFRKRAWEQKNGLKAPLMRVLPMASIMDERKDVDVLTQVLKEYRRQIKQPIKMVVIDTLNRCMSGEENSNTDMAEFVRGCERIQHEHQCGVMVIHHSGKDADRGARGATALKAATDYEIAVKKKDMLVTVENTRAKDVEPMKPVQCKFEVVTINGFMDYKGRPITSLVPVGASLQDKMSVASRTSDKEEALMDIIREHVNAIKAEDRSCPREDVKADFLKHECMADSKPTAHAQAFHKTMKSLKDRGWIDYDRDDIRSIFD